jgi:DNA-binding transcriptional LysR family regulator
MPDVSPPPASARRSEGRRARPTAAPALEITQLRALVALLTQPSVSAAAESLGQSQPQMSVQLRRLRAALHDPVLVRGAGRGMVPTERARALLEPARRILADMQLLFSEGEAFDPLTMRRSLRLAIPDFISADLLGAMLGAIRAGAPGASVVVVPVRSDTDGADLLASGHADVLIESNLIRSAALRYVTLFDDNVLSVAARANALVKPDMTLEQFLALPHVAAPPTSGTRPGMVDRMLAERGYTRRVVAWVPYFNALPRILAQSDLVLTTAGHLAFQFARQADLQVFAPPLKLPRVRYYLMWHERVQRSAEHRWLRDLIREAVTRQLKRPARGSAAAS